MTIHHINVNSISAEAPGFCHVLIQAGEIGGENRRLTRGLFATLFLMTLSLSYSGE